jgi:hypothetical protein
MTAYLPASIWVFSAAACLIIANRRHLKKTALRAMAVALLGPIAVPLVATAKPEVC